MIGLIFIFVTAFIYSLVSNASSEPVIIHRSSSNGSVKIVDVEAVSSNTGLEGVKPGASLSQTSPASVWKAVARVFGSQYAVAGVFKLIYDLISFVNPIILK